MKFSDLQEDGRIVKGVNTTVDVSTGQVSKEASKLVGKVNKDGYPPELHSKAKKNSKPNTLYNLGLAEALIQESQPNTPEPERYTALEWAAIEGGHTVENISHTGTATAHAAKKKKLKPGDDAWFKHWFSLPYFMKEGYKLELERDTRAGLLVLNILDTKTGKRTEVRGKPGYESGNYDPNDPLHQLIDRLGKAVDISQLMNGEPVGINPNHPDGASAKKHADTAFNESLNNPYNYKWVRKMDASWAAQADTENGPLLVQFAMPKPRRWSISFVLSGNYDKTGTGDQFRILATTIAVIRDWFSQQDLKKINSVDFTANKDNDGSGRTKLYARFAKQMANELGWELDVKTKKKEDTFVIQKPKKVSENFADGKKKGKSRPGRVKRAGASCKGSVTDLRKRAKKYSGERGKMYHWCANMKSGKKKK